MEKPGFFVFRKLLPYVALVVLLSVSVWGWRHYEQMSVDREQLRFSENVEVTVQDILERLDKYKMILQGGAGVFAASEEVNREEWRAYYEYQQLPARYTGVQGIGFSKVIQPWELEQHIQKVRAEGFSDYTIHPAGQRELYVPVIFLEPFDEINQSVLGYDTFSEPVRRAAMERARDTGIAAMSGKVRLATERGQDSQPGFVIYVPLYAKDMPASNVEERRAAIQGYVFGGFRIQDLVQGIFPEFYHKIDFQIYDGPEVSPSALMYVSHVHPEAQVEEHQPMFSTLRTLELYAHQWTLAFKSMPAFEAAVDRKMPKYILVAGLAISLLIFLLIKTLEGTGERAFALAQKMTSDLRESESKYRLVVDNMADVITTMDMDLRITYVSPSIFYLRGYTVDEVMAQSIEQIMTPESLQVASRALEEEMGLEASGSADPSRTRILELEEYKKDGSVVWMETHLSFMRDETQKPVGIVSVSRDITERKQAEEQLRQTLESLRNALGTTIQALVSAVETRDPYTAGHQHRTADLARAIATEMELPQEKIEAIRLAGPIHDVGKLHTPSDLLSKPTKLSEIEFSLIKEHARIGYEILKDVESPWPLAEIVYQHHERMDGSGYPRNLQGDEILMEARILAVADVVEAMASHRPYRQGLGISTALQEIENKKGVLYDADVVEACLKLFREKGYQFL